MRLNVRSRRRREWLAVLLGVLFTAGALLVEPRVASALMVGLVVTGGLLALERLRAKAMQDRRVVREGLTALEESLTKSQYDGNAQTINKLSDLQQGIFVELAQRLESIDNDVAALHKEVAYTAGVTAEVMSMRAELVKDIEKQRRMTVDKIRAAHRRQFQQMEALVSLYYAAKPLQPIPQTRIWAASPDLLWYLFRLVRAGSVEHILECGSGVSTLVFAYGLRERGEGRVVALEHDEHYAGVTLELLREHQLEDWADVRVAPLQPVELDGETWPWYDTATIPDRLFDLVLVDGPPGATREHARYPAVPLLLDRLADDGRVILDDYSRPEESEIGRRWLEDYPELTGEEIYHEKGTLVLRRRI